MYLKNKFFRFALLCTLFFGNIALFTPSVDMTADAAPAQVLVDGGASTEGDCQPASQHCNG